MRPTLSPATTAWWIVNQELDSLVVLHRERMRDLVALLRGRRAARTGKGYPEFDPDQPRDDSGRWSDSGGSGGDQGGGPATWHEPEAPPEYAPAPANTRAREARSLADFLPPDWRREVPELKALHPLKPTPEERAAATEYGTLFPHQCFAAAGAFILKAEHNGFPDARLVHGVYQPNLDLPVYAHGWVELPGNILFDGVQQRYFDKDDYYRVMRAKPERTYSRTQALSKMATSGHKGPWHDSAGV